MQEHWPVRAGPPVSFPEIRHDRSDVFWAIEAPPCTFISMTGRQKMALAYQSAHEELHYVDRAGWLRAAVLGANDGIVSVSSLIVGVAAADPSRAAILIAGAAGLAAGAMSMAAGEYVSVSSQSDVERADIARERQALIDTPEAEERELASIYESRGLSPQTASLVARELTEKDALSAHVRDELGLSEVHVANPLQAAFASGLTFTVAAAVPLVAAALAPEARIIPMVVIATLVSLAGLGALGAQAGGAPKLRATARVLFWGAAAMAITAGVGRLFGVSV
jgi:VIT1/CCC1 family predicted Fe2+/Mn2+ transporter